jgi:peptidoglycan hydrolase-like protein with peptidoglycan-binding domain
VSALQKGLKTYAAQNPAADPGAIDGAFGPRTAAAVRAYQTDHGVTVDAIVGRSDLVGSSRSGRRNPSVTLRPYDGIAA